MEDLLVQTTDGGSTTIDGGSGSDQVNLQTTSGPVIVNGGSGTSTIDVGTAYNGSYFGVAVNHFAAPPGGVLSQIDGLLRIDGGSGNSTVNLDDSGDTADAVSVLTGSTLDGRNPNPDVVQVITIRDAVAGTFTLQVGAGGPVTGALPFDVSAAALRAALEALDLPDVTGVTVTKGNNTYTIGFSGPPAILGEDLTLIPDSANLTSVTRGVAASIQVQSWSFTIQSVTVQAATGTFPIAIGNNLATVTLAAGESASQLQAALIAAIAGTGLVPAGHDPFGAGDVLVDRVGSTYYVTYQGLLAGSVGTQFLLSTPPAATVTQQGATSVQFTINAVAGTYTLETGNGQATYSLPWNATAAAVQAALVQPAGQQPDRGDGHRLGLLDHGPPLRRRPGLRRRFEHAAGSGADRRPRPGDQLQQRHDPEPRPRPARQRGQHPRDDRRHQHLRARGQ